MIGAKIIIIFPLAVALFLSQARAQNSSQAVVKECIPVCVKNGTSPAKGGPACTCTPEASLPGCVITACTPGQKSHDQYTCICTKEAMIDECVGTRCPNGTLFDAKCNVMCGCGADQIPDCIETSDHPANGNPACGCTPHFWPNGCTIRPCTSNTREDPTYFCQCTEEFSPDHCYKTRCNNQIGVRWGFGLIIA